MIKQNENLEQKDKVKFDLYKILRMSILLSGKEVDELTFNKFKEATLNIDKMLNEEYDKKLDTLFYSTLTLEEEEKRLKDLVRFINNRIEKRKNLVDDYRNVTSKELLDLEYIEKSGELKSYEKRLEIIKDYLDNSKLIEISTQDLDQMKEDLTKEFDLKQENEIKNEEKEEKLYNTFVNCLYDMDLYSELDLTNYKSELEELNKSIKEQKEQKETFETAFNNLKLSGISGDLEVEYSSYVENSRRNYYYVKEKEILLKLYKLIDEKLSEYSTLFNKREDIKVLLSERQNLRQDLNIKEKDLLKPVVDLVREQGNGIDKEKENIDNINVLTERVKLKENRLEELKKEINKPEILAILKEFSLIDTYEHEELDYEEDEEELLLEAKEEIERDLSEEENLEEEYNDEIETYNEPTYEVNQIKDVTTIPTMNYGLSKLKSISVMKRVSEMLGANIKKEETSLQEETLQEPTVQETKEEQKEELLWTPTEPIDIKKDVEEVPVPTLEETVPTVDELPPLEEVPQVSSIEEEPKTEVKQEDVFTTNEDIFSDNSSAQDNLVFPESAMPMIPEEKDEKFVWPEANNNFDINGIFPN